MLSSHIQKSLRENLGKKETKRIEEELYLWYKMDLTQAIKQFDTLDRILVNMYGKDGARALEKRFVRPVIEPNSKKAMKGTVTLTINDTDLINDLFTVIKDEGCMEIINILKKEPMIVSQIITHKKLQKYSDKTIYRKIGSLFATGCIMVSGYTQSEENKRVKVYRSTFDAIDLKIDGNNIAMAITIRKEIVNDSLILSTVFS